MKSMWFTVDFIMLERLFNEAYVGVYSKIDGWNLISLFHPNYFLYVVMLVSAFNSRDSWNIVFLDVYFVNIKVCNIQLL
jgi:hypothetical protein